MNEIGEQQVKGPQQIAQVPQHSTFEFQLLAENEGEQEQTIIFNSDFDSGNCGKVVQRSNFEYDIYTSPDRDQGTDQESYSKSWFYFSVKGFKIGQSIKLNIQQIHMLWSLWNNRACNQYKPVYKINQDGEYQKLNTEVQIQQIQQGTFSQKINKYSFCGIGYTYFQDLIKRSFQEKEYGYCFQALNLCKYLMVAKNWLVLSFEYVFEGENCEQNEVFFCFSYPYEYKKCIQMVKELTETYANDPDIYLHSEVITYSYQSRDIHLLTISSQEGMLDRKEDYISPTLFPERIKETRAKRNNKPYILITSRVHPGETPSSFALEGILKFLLNKSDSRAALLRQFFVFQIVPMLNPDGVYNGHYRMDTHNNNLNRFYKIADPLKQPSIFAIRKLVEYLQEDKRLFFYIDLHAHAGKKGHFVYGNACDDLVMQIENQTFAKILSMNCKNFEYNYCNFSKKHMKARDKFEEMTKEGCGRVQVHQITNIIHAYTLECGFHQATQLNHLPPITNSDFKINEYDSFLLRIYIQFIIILKQRKLGYVSDPAEESQSEIYKGKKEPPTFIPVLYENVGKAILITILDIFEKNPHSRIPNSQYKNIDNIRRSIGWDCARIERFRKDPYAYKKARKFNEYIQEAFFNEFERKKVFSFDSQLFKNTQWPDDLLGNFLHRYVSYESPKQNQSYKRQNKYYQIKSRIFEKRIISCSNIDEYDTEEFSNQNKNRNGFGLISTHKDNFNTEMGTFSNFVDEERGKRSIKDIKAQCDDNLNHSQDDINEGQFQSSDFNSFTIRNDQSKLISKSESPKKQSRHMSVICHIPPIKSQNIQIPQPNGNQDQVSFIYMASQQSQHISNSEKRFPYIEDGDSPIRPAYNQLSKKKKKKNYEQYLSDVSKNNNILQLSLHQQFNGSQIQNAEIRLNKKKDRLKNIMNGSQNEKGVRQFRMSSLNGQNESSQSRDYQQLNIQGNDRQFYIGGESALIQQKQNGLSSQFSNPASFQLMNKSVNNRKLIVSSRLIDKSIIKGDYQNSLPTKDSLLGSNHPSTSKLNQKREVNTGHHKNSHSMTSYSNIANVSHLKNNIQFGMSGQGFDDQRLVSAASTQANQYHQSSQSHFIGLIQTNTSQHLTSSSKSDLKIKNENSLQPPNQMEQIIKRTTSNQSSQSSQGDMLNKKVIRLSDTLNLMNEQTTTADYHHTQSDNFQTQENNTQQQYIPSTTMNYNMNNNTNNNINNNNYNNNIGFINESDINSIQTFSSPQKQQAQQQYKCYNIMDFPSQFNNLPSSNVSSAMNTSYGQNSLYQQTQLKANLIKKQPLQKIDQFYTQKTTVLQSNNNNNKSYSIQPTIKKKESPTINSAKKKFGIQPKGNKLFDVIFNHPSQVTINYSNYNRAINNQDLLTFNPDNEERQCEAITRIFSNFPGLAKQGIIRTERKQQQNNSFNLDEQQGNRNRKSEGGDEQFIKQINLFNSSEKQQNSNEFKLPDLKDGGKSACTEEDQNNFKLTLKLNQNQKSSKY